MASVVNTEVTHFTSAMSGAPVLNGTAGSLVGLLDACLVNGFDLKSASSLVVSSGVATLTFTAPHSATVDSVIIVSGSSIADLNGEQKITVVGAGILKFATAAANGTATGTITFKMAPANWTIPFTGTNLRTYKSGDVASTGMILRVDDTGTTMCRVVGYESMTDVNTGLGAFPTNTMFAGGGYWSKSSLANSTAVNWVLVADGRKFFLHIAAYFSTGTNFIAGITRGFGDDNAFRPGGDPYACSLSYSVNATIANQQDGAFDSIPLVQFPHPRNYTGLGSALNYYLQSYTGNASNVSGMDATFGTFPSVIDGGLRLAKRVFSATVNSSPRSDLPGLYSVPMSLCYDYFKTRDVLTGFGSLSGRKLIALNPTNGSLSAAPTSANAGVSFIDITGPWR